MKKRAFFPSGLLAIMGLWMAASAPVEAATVSLFSPQGEIRQVRQVIVSFSESMRPFGDLRGEAPFDIACEEKGAGRWVDDKQWSWDFERDLPSGVSCQFTLKKDLKTLAGHAVDGQQVFRFVTGGPAALGIMPRDGSESIEEKQHFMLVFDGALKAEEVRKHAHCEASGIAEKMPVTVLEGAGLTEFLKKVGSYSREELMYQRYRDSGMPEDMPGGLYPEVVLRCSRDLPSGADVRLVLEKGLGSASGIVASEDQSFSYKVRPAFRATFTCPRENSRAACNPLLDMNLRFNAPVSFEQIKAMQLVSSDGMVRKPLGVDDAASADVGGEEYDGEGDEGSDERRVTFSGPFPENVTYALKLPAGLKDDSGRLLSNMGSFPLKVATAPYPPLAKFAADFGVIELNAGAYLPITVRNLEPGKTATTAGAVVRRARFFSDEDVLAWYRWYQNFEQALSEKFRDRSGNPVETRGYSMLKSPMAISPPVASEMGVAVSDWLQKAEGAINSRADSEGGLLSKAMLSAAADSPDIEIRSLPKPLGKGVFEVVGLALPKAGFYLTELESKSLGASLLGKSVPMYVRNAALVTNLAAHLRQGPSASLVWVTTLDKGFPVANADVVIYEFHTGKKLWQGKTDKEGIARVPQRLDYRPHCPSGNYGCSPLFITARVPGDMTFVLSDWDAGIESWRYQLYGGHPSGDLLAHAVLDRTLLRAGETVHFKTYMRTTSLRGFALPSAFPGVVRISHLGGDEDSDSSVDLSVSFDALGHAVSEWKIPADAKLGEYSISVLMPNGAERQVGEFTVGEFRLPLMKGSVTLNPAAKDGRLRAGLALGYMSGGMASSEKVVVRGEVAPRSVFFEDFEDFNFDTSVDGAGKSLQRPDRLPLQAVETVLDDNGSATVDLQGVPRQEYPATVSLQMDYRDPNGEVQSISSQRTLWPAKVLVGIKNTNWASLKNPVRMDFLALDTQGRIVSGQKIDVRFFLRETESVRERTVGGFYQYNNHEKITPLNLECHVVADKLGRAACTVKAPRAGEIITLASVADPEGHISMASSSAWVTEGDYAWFGGRNDDRIELIPEKKNVEPGQNMTFQVRMPFRSATALVAVEREEIIETHVWTLSGDNPTISLPVKPEYSPNVYVSVLAVRGRVNDVQPTAFVDLGKPAYKLGIANVKVGWKGRQISVKVAPEKPVYQVRDKARVTISAAGPDKLPLAGGDVLVMAVDEALLELKSNNSTDLLAAMMQERGYAMSTATSQMQVVGKRHFGRKALPAGGGGGKGHSARELFDTLVFWNGRVKLDAMGKASVTVPLNDSLTSFRIIAVATQGTSWFGSGSASLRSTRDIQVLPGLPPLVREGDEYPAEITLRNTGDKASVLSVGGDIAGLGALPVQTLTLPAGGSAKVVFPQHVPVGATALDWRFWAKTQDGKGDEVKFAQTVLPAVPVQTLQATMKQVEGSFELPVKIPDDAVPGKGDLRVALSSSLTASLDGVRQYFREYPWSCLEQKTSIAVGLHDPERWRDINEHLSSYIDADGLAMYYPSEPERRWGSVPLTTYLLKATRAAGYEIDENSRSRLLDGLQKFAEGKLARESYYYRGVRYHAIFQMDALSALAQYDRATVAMLDSVEIRPDLWPTSTLIDWIEVLKALPDVKDHDAQLQKAKGLLRARINVQGSGMLFSTEKDDYLWWTMASPDNNANRLILTLMDDPEWRADMPRLMRGSVLRQVKGRWESTVSNVWGSLALEKFADEFEQQAVEGSTVASVAARKETFQWGSDSGKDADDKFRKNVLSLPWPARASVLKVAHQGSGKPWAIVTSRAAVPVTQPLSTGFAIRKSIVPLQQKVKGEWHVGDIAKVTLEIDSQADMGQVVVDDPTPAGSTVLGGSQRDPSIVAESYDYTWASWIERSFAGYRGYFNYVPKGKWLVSYRFRINQAGHFSLPPTRTEAMYMPEMFGLSPNAAWTVLP